MGPKIHIIRPSSNEPGEVFDALFPKWSSYENLILPISPRLYSDWPYVSASIQERTSELLQALESDCRFILSARGGYGASDLLDNIDFSRYQGASPKGLCGFSDASALISAFYSKLQWKGIHCPMPFTKQFLEFEDKSRPSSEAFVRFIETGSIETTINLDRSTESSISGPVFGGNLAVLTNLIGTPYIPKDLSGHILVFEDISEPPARVVRFLNQWKHSGLFSGIKAMILGDFTNPVVEKGSNQLIRNYIAGRFEFPIFCTDEVGHGDINLPFIVGELAEISGSAFIQNVENLGDN